MNKKIFGLLAVTLFVFGLLLWSTSLIWVNYDAETIPQLVRGSGKNETGLHLLWLFLLIGLVAMVLVIVEKLFKRLTFTQTDEYNLFSHIIVLLFPILTVASVIRHIDFLQDKGNMDVATILQDVLTPAFWLSVGLSLFLSLLLEILLTQIAKADNT